MFGRASSGQNECIESIRGNILEIRIQREVVPAFFRIGLIAFKVVDCRADLFAGLFPRTDCRDFAAADLKCLKRHHDFIILHEIPDDHQNLFCHFSDSLLDLFSGIFPLFLIHESNRKKNTPVIETRTSASV